jgi:hypothetical protein
MKNKSGPKKTNQRKRKQIRGKENKPEEKKTNQGCKILNKPEERKQIYYEEKTEEN